VIDEALNTYWKPNEIEQVLSCPICGRLSGDLLYVDLVDELENVPGVWGAHRCSECACVFLNPRPTSNAIGRTYSSYYTHARGSPEHVADNGTSLMWGLANGYLNSTYGSTRRPALKAGRYLLPIALPIRQQLDFFYRNLPRVPGMLLDVGCGNGLFLLRAKAAGWAVTGIDPDAGAVMAAQLDGLNVFKGTLGDLNFDHAFDVVTASHVIEHVHDPRSFVRSIFSVLQDGGSLWLTTPNVRSIGHKFFGKYWRGLEPPRHLTIFSKKALRRLLESEGYTSIRFRRRGRGARYSVQSSHDVAVKRGHAGYSLPVWLVDLCATLFAGASEELVVTAKRVAKF
jgi:2-polyprenyl-3-methyl-5-hydroxy-6-metoxy-1,4-benzoquinol methylase